jgi:hypothetical protein
MFKLMDSFICDMWNSTEAAEKSPVDCGHDSSGGFALSASCHIPVKTLCPLSADPSYLSQLEGYLIVIVLKLL